MKISAISILPIIAANFISQKEASGFLSEAKVRNRRGNWLCDFGFSPYKDPSNKLSPSLYRRIYCRERSAEKERSEEHLIKLQYEVTVELVDAVNEARNEEYYNNEMYKEY